MATQEDPKPHHDQDVQECQSQNTKEKSPMVEATKEALKPEQPGDRVVEDDVQKDLKQDDELAKCAASPCDGKCDDRCESQDCEDSADGNAHCCEERSSGHRKFRFRSHHHIFPFHLHKHKDRDKDPDYQMCKDDDDDKESKDKKSKEGEEKDPEENKEPEKDHKTHHHHGIGFKPMASCFDFRTRTVSFDLHNIGQSAKMSLLSKLLNRSKSESSMKVPVKNNKQKEESKENALSQSPKPSPGAPPRRRFMRVIRDDQCLGEEYVNPHVMRKYTKNHWEKHHINRSASLDDSDIDTRRPLPYTVTGHTILKKHHSIESDSLSDTNKHAKFKEEVEVLEYDIKGKCLAIHSDASILHAKLHDGELFHDEVLVSRKHCDAISIGSFEVELAPTTVTLDVIREAASPPDMSPDSDATETTVVTDGAAAEINSDSDVEELAEELASDSGESPEVFTETSVSDCEPVPKAARQISAEDECTVKKSKLENGQALVDTVLREAAMAAPES